MSEIAYLESHLMNSTEYAKAITAEDLHIFLNLWPSVFQGFDELQQSLADDQEKFLGNDAAPISWCHLYVSEARFYGRAS